MGPMQDIRSPGSFIDTLQRDPEAWALRINSAWRRSLESVIETGRLLIDAKANLVKRGQWEEMIGTLLDFSPDTAQRLMAIARDQRLTNPAHVRFLPRSYSTLHLLTRLSDEEFDRGIEQKIIRPDMERKEVEILRPVSARATPPISDFLPRDEGGRLTPEAKEALAPIIKEVRAEKIAAKKERRVEREATAGRQIQELPGNFFGVAIEDFEWHHKAWSGETGAERSPSMHYETAEDAQTPEAIVARCAERFACLAEICILFKWTTGPHLAIALKVLELQGFRYVTNLVWNKERSGAARGTGYWFTGEHELVLVGTRGNVVPPAIAHFRSNFSTPVGGHSEKPDNLHEIIEFHWPNTPKVEFNARRARPGWASWGNQAPTAEAAE